MTLGPNLLALPPLCVLALLPARRYPPLRPIAGALCALLALNAVKSWTYPDHWRADAAVLLLWPGCIAWLTWRTLTGRRGVVLACGWALAACVVAAVVPGAAYHAALVAARVLATAAVPLGWAWRESPGAHPRLGHPVARRRGESSPREPVADLLPPPPAGRDGHPVPVSVEGRACAARHGEAQHAHRRALAQARACALLLAAGNGVGLVLGAWQQSPPAWHLARAASWATYGAVAVVLLGALRRRGG